MRGCAKLSLLPVLVSAVLLGGCAFPVKSLTLSIAYDEAAASRGPLSSLEPRRIHVAPVTDKRGVAVTARIGHMINQYGGVFGHIYSRRPVPEIIQDAMVAELKKNGHSVNSDKPDVVFSADVNEFWIDFHIRTAAMTLTVTDGLTGAPLLTREYRGVDRRDVGWAVYTESTGQEVMNAALQRMMRDLATDLKLVEVLKAASASR